MISMIYNKYPLMHGAKMKLGMLPTEGGTRSSVLISSFKVNEFGR